MKIVVIGGTGLIGSKVAANLKQKGHEVLAAAPNTGVNTITGEGLKEALAASAPLMTAGRTGYLRGEEFGVHQAPSFCSRLRKHHRFAVMASRA
jgi:NAD(P)-dependent dehydrogenase (short-subunit alcohol dehydrogenase family)